MINIQTIQNVTDCVPLYLPHSLYLKPVARLNISVSLPNIKMGKSISNLDIMEKLSFALKPDKFLILKVSKSTVDFIRFEAELDERSHLQPAIRRLDGSCIKLSSFNETFRVRASEPKDEFPTRHDWDSFFRDATHMDEMKAGERPDTVHLTHLPVRWFCPRHSEQDDGVKPSESIFRRIFEKFGCVRSVDIPICDPYRGQMNADINGMKVFNFDQELLFEAYVQFDEYVGFVRTMDAFRGMKLVRKFVDKTQAINITVTFDKTKHLSDAQAQRRDRVRKRLISKAQADEEEHARKSQLEEEKMERERQMEDQIKLKELQKQREREEKRKEKHLKKIQERGQIEISQKIRIEERKLLIAQRKLESIRILEELFDRLKLKQTTRHNSSSRDYNETNKNDLRNRLVAKYKVATEKLLNEQMQKVYDIKNKTPLMGLLGKSKEKRLPTSSSDEDDTKCSKKKTNGESDISNTAARSTQAVITSDDLPLNPFKAVAAFAAANNATAYSNEAVAASEWMKSLTMFPYMSSMFSGMPAVCRQPNFAIPMNYRGFAPRIRGRGGRGRGRGRGGNNDNQSSSSYYNNYKHNNYEEEAYEDGSGQDAGYYKSSSYSSRYRNRSKSRKRHYSKRSRTRSRSSRRSRSTRSWSTRTSSSRSRTRTKSKSKSKSRKSSRTPTRTNKKLVSTRRSRSTVESSRSRSRSHSNRSWSRRSKQRYHANSRRGVVLETDKLVESAEKIKRSIESDTQQKMRNEEREIKENFRHRRQTPVQILPGGEQSYKILTVPSENNDANENFSALVTQAAVAVINAKE